MFRHSQILFIDLHHSVQCLTMVCYVSRDWPDLSILLQLSLKHSFGLPTGLEPDASSPYRSCFCGLLLSIRQTWASQCSRLLTNITLMSSVPARFSTSLLLMKWSHLILRMSRRCHCCIVQSCLTSCWYNVHVSLP